VVRGLNLFCERLRAHADSFVLIGGAACDEWFGARGLTFRATKDLDIALVVETPDREVVTALRQFIADGGYEIRQRANGRPIAYRFANPADDRFPAMVELFAPGLAELNVIPGHAVIPVWSEIGHHGLSAILLDDACFEIIRSHYEVRHGLRFATAAALIPLKARAWLNLAARRAGGETVDSHDVDKHRNDVFRLAGTLPGQRGPSLPGWASEDLAAFLSRFPDDSTDWQGILESVRLTLGVRPRPADLRRAVSTYFGLSVT
jgi:hypothetical protein